MSAPVAPSPAPAGPLPALLRPGMLLQALVLSRADGGAVLQIGRSRVDVATDLPLLPGERVTLRVMGTAQHPTLAIERPNERVGALPAAIAPAPPPLPEALAQVLGARLAALAGPGGSDLPAAVTQLAAEILDTLPEARALAVLQELLPDAALLPAEHGAPVSPRRLARLLQRAAAADARDSLGEELETLPAAERRALAHAVATRERAVLDASPALAWLRPLAAAAAALAEARPEPPARGAAEAGGAAFLLPSLPTMAPPDRLRLPSDPPDRRTRDGDGEPAIRAILELGLPGLGPTVAGVTLRGRACEVRIELAASANLPGLAAGLPELRASLEALGLTAAASVELPRTAVAEATVTAGGSGLELWA